MANQTPTTNGTKQIPVVQKQDPIYTLRHAVNRLFDEMTMGIPFPRLLDDMTGFVPRVDVKENQKDYVVSAELPGVEAKDVELKIVGDSLVLKGEKHVEKEESDENYHRVERTYGSFQRVLPLPAGVDREGIKAESKAGVLKVTLPKTQAAQSPAKKIEINQQ